MSSTPREVGTLIAVILKARNLPNKRHIGKQDPYCSISLNGEKRRTKAIKRGGQHPEWDEEIRFTLYEDTTIEQVALTSNGTPPPPPKKDDRALLKIKGGKSMSIACYAEDLREPDLIGEAKVDLTEVLTKGETDEWFTLMNKDKYSGEVYLELTFWSNEPPPAKKVTPKPKPKKQYGGPGSFVPSGDSPTPPSNGTDSLHSMSSRISSLSSISDSTRDSIPASLRASSSLAKVDLYVPPYETSRSHQQVPSVDSLTTDFSEFGVHQSSNRRTSMPPSQGYLPRPSSSIGFAEPQGLHSRPSYGYDQGMYADTTSSYGYDRPVTPTAPYHEGSMSSEITTYQAPYESTHTPYPPPARRPRYSIPSSSSGFMPIPTPTPAPSGFQSVASYPSMLPQPTGAGFMSSSSSAPTPAPFAFNTSPQIPPTPTPIGYGPPPSRLPVPTSSFPQSSFPTPMLPSTSFQTLPPSHSSQSSVTFPPYNGSGFSHQPPMQPSSQISLPPPPAPPPSTQPFLQQQQPLVPPPPSLPQHSYTAPGEHINATYTSNKHSSALTHVPPPPPLHDSPPPVQGQQGGSRPLPHPSQSQPSRRQSSLPIPPSSNAVGTYSPTNVSSFGYPSTSQGPPTPTHGLHSPPALGNQPPPTPGHSNPLPPPPPPPASLPYGNTHPAPGPPPPLSSFNNARLPSSSFPMSAQNNLQVVPNPPPALVPPSSQPQNTSRRPSLPPPPNVAYHQQSAFQSLPPPPPPPNLTQNSQYEVAIAFPSAFPSANIGQVSYPGPLPRPPSQYLSQSQSQGYTVPGGSWQ